jgi:mannitol-specific phosphotransferase system IIBC component
MKEVFDSTTKNGTAGGTLLTILANISGDDILKTIVLAAIGAVVSFWITLLMKFLIKKFRG